MGVDTKGAWRGAAKAALTNARLKREYRIVQSSFLINLDVKYLIEEEAAGEDRYRQIER
jgi:hypothetical protein